MAGRTLTREQILTLLVETPRRIADAAGGPAPAQLRAAPNPGAWSVNDVLAHLPAFLR